jgi:hypothetical protein
MKRSTKYDDDDDDEEGWLKLWRVEFDRFYDVLKNHLDFGQNLEISSFASTLV